MYKFVPVQYKIPDNSVYDLLFLLVFDHYYSTEAIPTVCSTIIDHPSVAMAANAIIARASLKQKTLPQNR